MDKSKNKKPYKKDKKLKKNNESSIRLDTDMWESDDKFSEINFNSNIIKETNNNEKQIKFDELERGNWTGRFDFLLSLLGYSVGLGNVWRFPYLCYNNGGGAFLIPFTIMLIIAGLPLMFMELSFGQYAALGPVAIYKRFCPLFCGLGYGMIIVSTIVMLYYNLIIAWTIFYMFASFSAKLPWQNCEPEWSTEHCFSYQLADECKENNGTYYLRTCYNNTLSYEYNISELSIHSLRRPPAEEYFNNKVLGLSSGIEETGEINLKLAISLFVAWLIVFLCLCKGVKSSGKVVYFTALFPYFVLVILFFRGITLPGAKTGILFYLTPDFRQLASAQVWGDAAVQIFFALSPAWGGLITLSSYNKFTNDCYKDSLIVAVSNILTSFFAGLVIFSIIGFLAHELGVEVEKVVDQGAGLAFIVYPEVVTRLPIAPVWSVLFFVMLLTLGLDSQFALMETVTTAILDKFPNLRQSKFWVVLAVALLGYAGGLGFTTNSGMYWLQLMDKYAANWSVLLIAISECCLISWCYGSERYLNDIQGMFGKKSKCWFWFWSVMWKFITPATLLFILIFNWIKYKPATYGNYVYPFWADIMGWIIGLFPIIVVLIAAIFQIFKAPKNLKFFDKFKFLLRPTCEWGPAGRPCYLSSNQTCEMLYDDAMKSRVYLNDDSPISERINFEIGGNYNKNESDLKLSSASSGSKKNPFDVLVSQEINDGNKTLATISTRMPGPSILKNSNKNGNSLLLNTLKQTNLRESSKSLLSNDLRNNYSVGSCLSETISFLPTTNCEVTESLLTTFKDPTFKHHIEKNSITNNNKIVSTSDQNERSKTRINNIVPKYNSSTFITKPSTVKTMNNINISTSSICSLTRADRSTISNFKEYRNSRRILVVKQCDNSKIETNAVNYRPEITTTKSVCETPITSTKIFNSVETAPKNVITENSVKKKSVDEMTSFKKETATKIPEHKNVNNLPDPPKKPDNNNSIVVRTKNIETSKFTTTLSKCTDLNSLEKL